MNARFARAVKAKSGQTSSAASAAARSAA